MLLFMLTISAIIPITRAQSFVHHRVAGPQDCYCQTYLSDCSAESGLQQ
jgi:hypothetical protein